MCAHRKERKRTRSLSRLCCAICVFSIHRPRSPPGPRPGPGPSNVVREFPPRAAWRRNRFRRRGSKCAGESYESRRRSTRSCGHEFQSGDGWPAVFTQTGKWIVFCRAAAGVWHHLRRDRIRRGRVCVCVGTFAETGPFLHGLASLTPDTQRARPRVSLTCTCTCICICKLNSKSLTTFISIADRGLPAQ